MKITDALRGEHGMLYATFDHLERVMEGTADGEELRALAAQLAGALVPHARTENELLFPAAEAELGPIGPIAVMRAEHADIEGTLNGVAAVGDPAELRRLLRRTIALAREHFRKEETILFPAIDRALSDGVLRRLGAQWANERGVALP